MDLDSFDLWPPELLALLEREHQLFLSWERGDEGRDPRQYDRAIAALRDALQPYALTGWHCTRLTDEETQAVLATGLQLPDASMLLGRIDRLVAAGSVPNDIARTLKARHQASDSNRAGKVWFCFYPPRLAGERGIERFFRHWGGEALYNSHEDDAATSPVLRKIGTPALVEADVPVALLYPGIGLARIVVHRFVTHHGFRISERTEHDNYIVHPLPIQQLRRVIRFPEPGFLALTGCLDWQQPLTM